VTYEEEQIVKERNVEAKKNSLRTQSRQLDYAAKITSDLSFHASIFLEEQHKLSLAKDETAAQLLKRLSELQEAAAALSSEFNALSMVKLREADSITLLNFEE
jgi:hypothetical protein